MKVMRRSRWLARLAAVLPVGVAGPTAAAPAPAQAGIASRSHVVASWGDDWDGELGDGTTTSRSQYGDIRFGNDVVQVAAGYWPSAWPCGPTAPSGPGGTTRRGAGRRHHDRAGSRRFR